MAKRFTDTGKWKKEFIKGLPAKMKLLWFYILDDCDHAGIWEVDMEVASLRIGETITYEEAFIALGEKIHPLGKNKWFIRDFIFFQYGDLRESNRMHQSVISILKKNQIPLVSPFEGAKDKEQDKDKVKDKVKDTPAEIIVEVVPRETGILPREMIWQDELYREYLTRLARDHAVHDVGNLLARWEGWYVNKFEWKKKSLQEMRLSFESWIKDPKSRQNGKHIFSKNDRTEFNQNEFAIITAHASGGGGT